MGRMICKECGKDSGDVTPFCDHCHARQHPAWLDWLGVGIVVLPSMLACAGCQFAFWMKVIFYFLE
jgi:hypothetical protein